MRVHEMRLAGRTITGHVVENEDDLPAFADWAKRHTEFGFDTETTSLEIYKKDHRLRAAQFSVGDQTWLLPVERHPRFAWYAARTLQHARRLYIHNAAFDLQVADRHLGVSLAGTFAKTIDTGIISRLVDSRTRKERGPGHKLEELTEVFIDPVAARDIKGSVGRQCKALNLKKEEYFSQVSLDDEVFQLYALMDPVLAWVLAKVLGPKVPDSAKHLIPYEHEIARICADISKEGFLLDQTYTTELATRLRQEETWWQIEIEQEIERLGFIDPDEFNPNSTDQVFEALLYMGHEEFEQTPTGKPKVDDSLLEYLADNGMYFARCIKELRKAGKWAATWPESFLANADEYGRCHANINTLQARTARMSITGIPAQTLPSADWLVRRCFLADEGHVVASVDYSNMELRVMAARSDDPKMIEAFKRGDDLHLLTARAAFGQHIQKDDKERKYGKGANFTKAFGGGIDAIVQQYKIDWDNAAKVSKAFDATYTGVTRYSKELQKSARSDGFITSATGRRLYVDKERPYSSLNYDIQSSSRDITGAALVRLDKAGFTPYMRLPIHDEVLFSFPKAEAKEMANQAGELMKHTINGLEVPTDPEVGGRSWGSLYGADY
ncbi:DNA polymerase [Streptosporangium sp. NPDC000239]|uniref:DNA polymerase n=1 Tax=Streptosporangium sp. NPDC000239 TaxID=3154248 RepID=UPI00332F09B9